MKNIIFDLEHLLKENISSTEEEMFNNLEMSDLSIVVDHIEKYEDSWVIQIEYSRTIRILVKESTMTFEDGTNKITIEENVR